FYDYQKYRLRTSLNHTTSWRGLRFELSLLGQLTRGAQRRNLQEVYRSVDIFSPGTGQNAFEQLFLPLLDQGESFALAYGDSKADATLSIDFPLLTDLDYLIRIAYVDRLIFKSKFKYGGAWNG